MNRSKPKHNWLAVLATLVLALPLYAPAAPPNRVTVTAAYPAEAFQGEELSVTVTGSGFDAGSMVGYFVTGTTDASQVDVLMVEFISPSELKTFIRPKDNALVSEYDIEVQTTSGRKGKGTTLFRVKQKTTPGGPPPPPPPTATEPAARWGHSFTDNGGATPGTSRLYVFGGEQNVYQPMTDHWYYSVADGTWTPAPTNSSAPAADKFAGFSCGGGRCVLAGGLYSGGDDTWVYTESTGIWSQVNCKRYPCPSARQMPTMAYDSARGRHLLFGGYDAGTSFGDTYTFSNATQRWTRQKPAVSPVGRHAAAAAFVAGPVNRVVLHGGLVFPFEVRCDLWSWTGSNWEAIEQINGDEGPCLYRHSVAWDGTRLVVTGGHNGNTYDESVWTFEFTPDGRAGTWTYEGDWYFYFECSGAGVLRPGSRMAYDLPSGSFVFFGGGEDLPGVGWFAYDDLSVCN